MDRDKKAEPIDATGGPGSVRPFSLSIYLLVVVAFSWPFQFAYAVLGEEYRPVLLLSMVRAGVGTWVAACWWPRSTI